MSEVDGFAGFSEFVTSDDALQEVIGTPSDKVLRKVQHRLDEICLDFIAASPFCVIATSNPAGYIDLSPKGDPAGFIKVLDDTHLAIPDRPGNRRIDTFHNLMRDPRIGIMFVIPGKDEVLRVRGEARIVRDAALRETMAVNGKVPTLATVVHVTEAFVHCPKAMIRGAVWHPERWPDSSGIADIRHAMSKHADLPGTIDEQTAEVEREGLTALY